MFFYTFQVQTAEMSLLVRALERLYSRLVNFGRSILEVVAPNEPSEAAEDFKRCLNDSCLEAVLRIASKCGGNELNCLKTQTADCMTGIRQQLVTNAGGLRPGVR